MITVDANPPTEFDGFTVISGPISSIPYPDQERTKSGISFPLIQDHAIEAGK